MENCLETFIKENQEPREIKRGLAVKMSLSGYKHRQIMPILGVSSGFISKWKQRFEKLGIQGLKLNYKGAKSYLKNEEKAEIIDWLKTKNYWNLEELEAHLMGEYGVIYHSKQSYYDLFKAAKISWKKSQKKNPKRDDALVESKREEIREFFKKWLWEIQTGKVTVFFVDECHLLWGDICGYVWGKTNSRVEIPIINERERQTYFGALNYQTNEFVVKPYKTANGEKTKDFVKYLREICPSPKVVLIWDGASYHRGKEFQEYLKSVNQNLSEDEWLVTCLRFAPNAPEQNPVEDIWLQAKRFIREFYCFCSSFSAVKALFELVSHHQIFDFPKIHLYDPISQMI